MASKRYDMRITAEDVNGSNTKTFRNLDEAGVNAMRRTSAILTEGLDVVAQITVTERR